MEENNSSPGLPNIPLSRSNYYSSTNSIVNVRAEPTSPTKVPSESGTEVLINKLILASSAILILVLIVFAYLFYLYLSNYKFSSDNAPKNSKQANASVVTAGESVMYTIPEDISKVIKNGVGFSDDHMHFAYIVNESTNKNYVVWDGKKGKEYNSISSLTLSKNGDHLMYIVNSNSKSFVVIDNKEGVLYDQINDVVFSPNGERYAYKARKGDLWYAVIDGKAGKAYKDLPNTSEGILFSPDSARYAYVAEDQNNNQMMVEDGIEGKVYTSIADFTFSPNSKNLAYTAFGVSNKKGACMVLNNKEQKIYYSVGDPVFSPDSSKLAYSVSLSEKNSNEVVVNGVESGNLYENTLDIHFSDDGRNVAYLALEKGQYYLVKDNKIPLSDFSELSDIVFNKDFSEYAYSVMNGNESYVSINGVKGDVYPTDNTTIPPTSLFVNNLKFSPDGKHFAYGMYSLDSSSFIVLDNKQDKLFDNISNATFTDDSKYLVYNSILGNKLMRIVRNVNNPSIPTVDELLKNTKLLTYTDSKNSVSFEYSSNLRPLDYINLVSSLNLGATTSSNEHYLSLEYFSPEYYSIRSQDTLMYGIKDFNSLDSYETYLNSQKSAIMNESPLIKINKFNIEKTKISEENYLVETVNINIDGVEEDAISYAFVTKGGKVAFLGFTGNSDTADASKLLPTLKF